MVYSYIIAFLLVFIPAQTSYTELSVISGKVYQPKDKKYGYTPQYNRQQKLYRGTEDKKIYTTCRLAKTIKSKHTGRQACIYRGGNKTFELMYENNCPKQYKCVYNPNQKEPNIDDVIDSLNNIKK